MEEHLLPFFCHSSVNHRSPASSCLTGCSLPLPFLLKPPILFASEIRKGSTRIEHFLFFQSDSGPLSPSCLSRRKRKRKIEHDLTGTNQCLLHALLAAAFTTGCGRHAKTARTCQSSKAEFPSCYVAWSVTENAAAAYLRICSERVDPELQQNPCPDSKDCQCSTEGNT